MFVSAFISFASFALIMSHISPRWMRRIVGYKMLADIVLHGTILYMFFNTSTEGLLQAEAAGILFSIYLRAYRKFCGFERLQLKPLKWTRYTGILNRDEGVLPQS